MQPTLVAVAGPLIGSRIVLAGPSMVVGRSQRSEIVVSDPSVSRHHCTITKGEDGDLKLVNHRGRGTLVNGQPVEEHVHRHEDLIRLGTSGFVVYLHKPSPDPTWGDNDPRETASVLLDRMKRGDGAAGEALMRRTLPALRAMGPWPSATLCARPDGHRGPGAGGCPGHAQASGRLRADSRGCARGLPPQGGSKQGLRRDPSCRAARGRRRAARRSGEPDPVPTRTGGRTGGRRAV